MTRASTRAAVARRGGQAHSERGNATLEFAIYAGIFITILIGVTDLSFYLIAAMGVEEAANEGASYGASPGNQNDNTGMVVWANQAATGVALNAQPISQTFFTCSPGGAQVSASAVCANGAAPMEYVKVTVTATLNPLFQATFLGSGTTTAIATYRVAWRQ